MCVEGGKGLLCNGVVGVSMLAVGAECLQRYLPFCYLLFAHLLQVFHAPYIAVPIVGSEEREHVRHFDTRHDRERRFVGALHQTFGGCQLHRLVLRDIHPMFIAGEHT